LLGFLSVAFSCACLRFLIIPPAATTAGEAPDPPKQLKRAARRKLLLLRQARSLNDLRVPYGNHLEALKDDRAGQHSIRVNDQWRICFRWQGQDAFDVEIVDYH
jgi:proteic killer suppression protein